MVMRRAGARTVSETFCEAVAFALSVTMTVKLNVPAAGGSPAQKCRYWDRW